jgi:hypothetical protein
MAISIAVVLCIFSLLGPEITATAQSDEASYTFDIREGNIAISVGTNSGTIKVEYGNGEIVDNIYAAQEITITDSSPDTPTANVIAVNPNIEGTLNITLDNVNISRADASPLSINGTVNLTLTGANYLTSGYNRSIGVYSPAMPGLLVPPGATLEITASSTGSLNAQGGTSEICGGAGVGGAGNNGYGDSSGTVIINGGTVSAIGGSKGTTDNGGGGAGIGGGSAYQGGEAGSSGPVIINGGTVIAIGSNGGAGIGGGRLLILNGRGGSSGSVTINGGTVTATGNDGGAGIGGGCAPLGFGGHGGAVTINGGTVTATANGHISGTGAAGIGGSGGTSGGNGGSVTINGGWVKATGGGGGAGIGGGPSTYTTGSGGAVTINGGTVFAIGSSNYWGTGSGIGGGYGASASGGYIGAAGTVTITGGSVYASSIQAAVKNSDGNGVIQAPVSGLPANTGISYTDNGGNPISCATDPQGKIYLWLIPGTHVIGISAGAIQYSIVGILPDTANYFEILPDDANLTMVCNQVISTTGGLGTSADPYSASIIVPNSQATVSLTDLMPHNTYAAAALYADGDFATTTGSVELVPGAETTIYICVTSQEGTHQLYYELNVLRLSADAVLSKACNQAISTTGGSGTSVDPYLASISVPYTQVAVTVADLTPRSTYATTNLYTNSSFITATGIFNLEPGAATDVYIGVTSQDETATLYYRVSVTPMSSYILDISAGNITAAAGTKLGTFKLVWGNPQVTLDSIPLSMPITIMDSTAGIASTANTVTIDVNSAMSIILDGVNMNNSASPFVIVSGSTVNLTLQGTNTLTCSDRGAGLQVNDNAVLNITADSTGSLLANGGILTLGSGIGSSDVFDNTGTVTISGGMVTATGGDMGAGIGSAGLGSGGKVTIMGGTVTATGGATFGAGIGGISNVTVIINGGMVTATGFASPDMGGLPGIGSSNNCRVEINGGTVIASSALCAGIGGDSNPYYTGGTVTINGGKVTATSGFVGIGGANILVTVNGGTVTAIGSTNDLGGSKVIINGGSVNARAQSLVYNSSNDPEYLVTVTGLPQNYALSYSVEGGNTVSCSTDASGKLYLWLPASGNATAIEFAGADGGTYSVSGTVQGAGSDSGGTWAVGSVEPIDECFIATAAFGSKFEPSVALLRDFRDKYLLTNTLGKSLVNFYYQNSPPLAAMIAASEPLKIAARVMLAPVIAIVYLIYHPILLVAVLALLIAFLVYRFKLRKRYSWNCPI